MSCAASSSCKTNKPLRDTLSGKREAEREYPGQDLHLAQPQHWQTTQGGLTSTEGACNLQALYSLYQSQSLQTLCTYPISVCPSWGLHVDPALLLSSDLRDTLVLQLEQKEREAT